MNSSAGEGFTLIPSATRALALTHLPDERHKVVPIVFLEEGGAHPAERERGQGLMVMAMAMMMMMMMMMMISMRMMPRTMMMGIIVVERVLYDLLESSSIEPRKSILAGYKSSSLLCTSYHLPDELLRRAHGLRRLLHIPHLKAR
jgi:hypothetical protein